MSVETSDDEEREKGRRNFPENLHLHLHLHVHCAVDSDGDDCPISILIFGCSSSSVTVM